jgi:hypothetical protein
VNRRLIPATPLATALCLGTVASLTVLAQGLSNTLHEN